MTLAFHADQGAIEIGTIRLETLAPIIDGAVVAGAPRSRGTTRHSCWSGP